MSCIFPFQSLGLLLVAELLLQGLDLLPELLDDAVLGGDLLLEVLLAPDLQPVELLLLKLCFLLGVLLHQLDPRHVLLLLELQQPDDLLVLQVSLHGHLPLGLKVVILRLSLRRLFHLRLI